MVAKVTGEGQSGRGRGSTQGVVREVKNVGDQWGGGDEVKSKARNVMGGGGKASPSEVRYHRPRYGNPAGG